MSTIHACYHPELPLDGSIIKRMLKASEYWKPDKLSQGQRSQYNCYLAKASLFTTERSKQDDVYIDPASQNMITANARIDNRGALAKKLKLDANALADLSDGQLILRSYEKWGEGCAKELLGDFVFIIWDEQKSRLFAARDHFGVKVLYYCQNDNGTMLTNEHNAFFTSDWQSKVMNESWLVRHLWGQNLEPVESPYEGIKVLQAAHYMVFDKTGVTTCRYWSLEDKNDWIGLDDEALIAQLKSHFIEAVKVRLDSAYPVGAELSEGLDSNGIVGHAAQILGEEPLMTFSYNCERLTDENLNIWGETYKDIFEMLALHQNLKPIWDDNFIDDFNETLEKLYGHLGGVMDFGVCLFSAKRLAQRKGVKVMLSGWGGDHCVSSPGDFYESELFVQGKWGKLNRLHHDKSARGRGMNPVKAWAWLFLKHFAPKVFRTFLRHRPGLEGVRWRLGKQSPLKSYYIKRYALKENLVAYLNGYQKHSVKAYDKRELFEVGVEWRLVETEFFARMHRIEYRYPMLDIPLVELAHNLPSHLKINNGVERYMFRRVLEGVTTKRIQWRRKADVNHPLIQNRDIAKTPSNFDDLAKEELVRTYFDRVRFDQVLKALKVNDDSSLADSLKLMKSIISYTGKKPKDRIV